MMAFIGAPDEIRDLFREDECARHETVLREQMSGPCVHYGPHGCEIPCRTVRTLEPIDDDCVEIEECPHLYNASVTCPIKDLLGPAHRVETPASDGRRCRCSAPAVRRPQFREGDKVRISHPTYKGYTGTIRRYDAATANYLTHIDGTTDTMWLSEDYLEAV